MISSTRAKEILKAEQECMLQGACDGNCLVCPLSLRLGTLEEHKELVQYAINCIDTFEVMLNNIETIKREAVYGYLAGEFKL